MSEVTWIRLNRHKNYNSTFDGNKVSFLHTLPHYVYESQLDSRQIQRRNKMKQVEIEYGVPNRDLPNEFLAFIATCQL